MNGLTGGLKLQGEDDSYDFGSGAGFYVDATKGPWKEGYKMYSYITSELPRTVFDNFEQVDGGRVSVFGHSMGGHGALSLVGLVSWFFRFFLSFLCCLLCFPTLLSFCLLYPRERGRERESVCVCG